ncbi:Integrator complex subunit 10 [Heterocephalus glaber]|uniref:Integrator complex subunit 10 n=1 Tax=Heterocephalus glaber TaxID=10181 RepID=G5B7F2_HETGA|nr:Integrator complex subunit 10 [Heterocephalus glaber]
MLVFLKNPFQDVNSIQPSLFQGPNAPNQVPLVLLEDVLKVYGDVEIYSNKHIHKRGNELREEKKTMSSDDEDYSAKGRNRHIVVNKAELTNSIEMLESFKLARESWELLYSLEFLEKKFIRICLPWKTDTWLWLRIFLTNMIIYQGTLINHCRPFGWSLQLSGRCCEQNSAPSLGHHTVTRGINKGVKEDFCLAMEHQVSHCGENLMVVLHRFCINEILLLQTLI